MLGLAAVAALAAPGHACPGAGSPGHCGREPLSGHAPAATIPRLVPRDQLQSANAIRAAVGPLAIIVGPALGALLLVFGDATLAFETNAATFVGSAVLTGAISAPGVFRPSPGSGAGRLVVVGHRWGT